MHGVMEESPSAIDHITNTRRRSPKWRSVTLAVLAAAIVVVAGLFGYWLGRQSLGTTGGTSGSGTSLNVLVQTNGTGGQLVNLSGAAVGVFSVLPLVLLHPALGLDLAQLPNLENPYFVELGSGVTDSSGQVAIPFSALFGTIVAGWRAMISPPTENVSVELEVTYVAYQGTNASLYHYYDQVDYDPYLPSTTLAAHVVLNLSVSDTTVPLLFPPKSFLTPPSGSCGNQLTSSWSTVSLSVISGYLPLAGLINNMSSGPMEFAEVGDGWILSPTVRIGLGGVQVSFPGRIDASVDPAWTGLLPNFAAQSGVTTVYSNATHPASVATVSLAGAIYLVVGQVEHLVGYDGDSCGSFSLNVTRVTISIPYAATGLPVGGHSIFWTPDGANDTGQEIESLPDQTLLNSTPIPLPAPVNGTDEPQWYELISHDISYARALQAEGLALSLNVSYVFSVNLGEDLLLATAAQFGCGAFGCYPNPSRAYELPLEAELGPALAVLPSLGAYGFGAEVGATYPGEVQIIGFNAPFINISAEIYLYGGLNQTTLDVNGQLYSATVPSLGPVYCHAGTSPGHGC